MCHAKTDHSAIWTDLLDKKFRRKETPSRADFDRVLAGCSSVADWPASLLSKELVMAYPEAKVILTVRDSPDKWYNSFNDTIWYYQRQKHWPNGIRERFWAYQFGPGPHDSIYRYIIGYTPFPNFPTQGKQWYLDHNEMMRQIVPPDNLLEFNAKQGWEPLCNFLGKPVPSTPYPRVNDSGSFQSTVDPYWAIVKIRRSQKLLRWFSIWMIIFAVIVSFLSQRRAIRKLLF